VSDSIPLLVAFLFPFALALLVWFVSQRRKRPVDLVPSAGGDPATLAEQADPRTVAEQVEALLRAGKKILAVKLVRDRTGLSLREAKEAVEVIERDGAQASPGLGKLPLPGVSSAPSSPGVPPTALDEVRTLARQGRKIEAIKLLRQHTRISLKEAKKTVERL